MNELQQKVNRNPRNGQLKPDTGKSKKIDIPVENLQDDLKFEKLSIKGTASSSARELQVQVDEWFLMDSELFDTLMSMDLNKHTKVRPSFRSAERKKFRKTDLYEIVHSGHARFLVRSQTGEQLHAPSSHVHRHIASRPRLKLLIFDMNGVLIDRPKKGHSHIARPGLVHFLTTMLRHFAVAVWTSAIEKNAVKCLQAALPEDIRQNIFLFLTREHCTLHETEENPYGTIKDLSIIWANPKIYGRWDKTNSLLLDDSIDKGINHPDNVMLIPTFVKAARESDRFLHSLSEFLLTVLYTEADVRAAAQQWRDYCK